MSERLSVIIPVFNGAETIQRAINSAHWALADHILVYDDGSTDKTLDELECCAKNYPELEVYADLSMNMRRGVNFARNYLCEHAQDGLILPLDADDTLKNIHPLRLAWQQGVWCYGDYQEINGQQSRLVKGAPAGVLARKELTGISFLFHRDDWKKAGGYDSDFAYVEDYGLQCSLTNIGIRPHYVDTIVYNRYLKPQGNTRSAYAREYWLFYRSMAKLKYPSVFAGQG